LTRQEDDEELDDEEDEDDEDDDDDVVDSYDVEKLVAPEATKLVWLRWW